MCKVSVIIPTYNRQQWLQEAIDSVLAQHDITLECIVVDDGSTDNTREVLANRYGERIRYIWQENQGESSARNHGAEVAKGEYLAFLDSDDRWLPDKLNKQSQFLDTYPNFAAVYCMALGINEMGDPIPRLAYGIHMTQEDFTLLRVLRQGLPLGGSTMMVRRTAHQKINGFDINIHRGEDLDFCIRLFLEGFSIGLIKEPLTLIRSHSNSQSLVLDEKKFLSAYQDHLRMYERILTYSISDETRSATNRDLARENMVQYVFYLYHQHPEKSSQYLSRAMELDSPAVMDSSLIYGQIAYYTPLIYMQDKSQKNLLDFIRMVLKERDRFTKSKPVEDALILLKTSVWCANRGSKTDWSLAYQLCTKTLKEHPQLLFNAYYWNQIGRLFFGKLFVRLVNWRLSSFRS